MASARRLMTTIVPSRAENDSANPPANHPDDDGKWSSLHGYNVVAEHFIRLQGGEDLHEGRCTGTDGQDEGQGLESRLRDSPSELYTNLVQFYRMF
jgi:hypothetical protein